MLNHPWLSDPNVSAYHRRSMTVGLKSIEEMLSGEDPPEWVVLLNRICRRHNSGARIVIHECATVDYEADFDQPPKTWRLGDADYQYLTGVLREVRPGTFNSVNTDIIDGDSCALTVVHGKPKWLAYAEVNLAGLPQGEHAAVVRLAKKVTAIVEKAANNG